MSVNVVIVRLENLLEVEVHVQTARADDMLVVQATLDVLNVQQDITIMERVIQDVLKDVQREKAQLFV